MALDQFVRRWATAISTHESNGRKIFLRFSQEFSPDFLRASQPDCIHIFWDYPSESGQPLHEEHQRIIAFEDAIATILRDVAPNSTLAMVSTGECERQWTYYSESAEEFIGVVERALKTTPDQQIETIVESDPTWSQYDKFVSSIVGL